MSFKEYEAVGESSLYDGSGPTKAVLSRIAYLIRDKRPTPTCPVGWSNVSEGYLTKWTGFSERTVRAAIQTLVKDEIVFRQTYRIPGGFRKNRYALNMGAIKAALRPEFNPDVEELQAGGTYGDVDSDSQQAGETYTHRRNRPVPQAGKTEATGGSRLKAVGFSSWGKQVDSAVTQADQTTDASLDHFVETRETLDPNGLSAYLDDDDEPLPPVQPSAPQATKSSAAPEIRAVAEKLQSLIHPASRNRLASQLADYHASLNGGGEEMLQALKWFALLRDEGQLHVMFPTFRESAEGYSLDSFMRVVPKIQTKYAEEPPPVGAFQIDED